MNTYPFEFDEQNHLSITAATWNDLIQGGNAVAFAGIKAAADLTIRRGGAFIVYEEVDGEGGDIIWRCDRVTELEDCVADANARRRALGLEAFID